MSTNDPLGGMLEGPAPTASTPAFHPTRPLTATISVPSGTPANPSRDTVGREMPFDGWLAEVTIGVDSSHQQLVGTKIYEGKPTTDGKRIIPFNSEDEYATPPETKSWGVWIPVEEGDTYSITVENRDSDNGHAVPVELLAAQFIEELHGDLPAVLLPASRRS